MICRRRRPRHRRYDRLVGRRDADDRSRRRRKPCRILWRVGDGCERIRILGSRIIGDAQLRLPLRLLGLLLGLCLRLLLRHLLLLLCRRRLPLRFPALRRLLARNLRLLLEAQPLGLLLKVGPLADGLLNDALLRMIGLVIQLRL